MSATVAGALVVSFMIFVFVMETKHTKEYRRKLLVSYPSRFPEWKNCEPIAAAGFAAETLWKLPLKRFDFEASICSNVYTPFSDKVLPLFLKISLPVLDYAKEQQGGWFSCWTEHTCWFNDLCRFLFSFFLCEEKKRRNAQRGDETRSTAAKDEQFLESVQNVSTQHDERDETEY